MDIKIDIDSTTWARAQFEKRDNDTKEANQSKNFELLYKTTKKSKLRKWLPWNSSLKNIECKHGGAHLSLFEFNRWLVFFNFIICLFIGGFILLPQYLYNTDKTLDDLTNSLFPRQVESNSTSILSLCLNSDLEQEYNRTENISYSKNTVNELDYFQRQLVLTKCCSDKYQEFLTNRTKSKSQFDIIIDYIQGTGDLEDQFLFYGYYGNRTISIDETTKSKRIYYMGLSFAFISLTSLIISALAVLLRLGKGISRSIVGKLDSVYSVRFCNLALCSWDFKVDDKDTVVYNQASVYRYFKSKMEDLEHKEKISSMSRAGIIFLWFKRILTNFIIIALFMGAGYGFYNLNQWTTKQAAEKDSILYEIVGSSALQLRIISLLFSVIFNLLEKLENHSQNTALTLNLLRNGFAKIGSLFFLIVTITVNVLLNTNPCALQTKMEFTQSLGDLNLNTTTNLYCYETYIGQEFYRLVMVDLLVQFAMLLLKFLGFLVYKCIGTTAVLLGFNLESTFLDLLYTQTIFWLSIYFSPFLGMVAWLVYVIKYYINLISLNYLTKKNDKPQIQSKINTSFFIVLFIIFLLVLLVFGFLFNTLKPSRSCGPFRIQLTEDNDDNFTILGEIRNALNRNVIEWLTGFFEFVFSNLFLWALAFILIIIIWLLSQYSKFYKQLANELRIIVNEEHQRTRLLAQETQKCKSILDQRKAILEEKASQDEKHLEDEKDDAVKH